MTGIPPPFMQHYGTTSHGSPSPSYNWTSVTPMLKRASRPPRPRPEEGISFMCGRYTLNSSGDEIALLFDLSELPQVVPRYNLAPTQEAAVVRVPAPGAPRQLVPLRWGLIPYWAKEAAIGNKMINARAESVAEKASFKWSFKKKRCLIPPSVFSEWKRGGKPNQPYLIHRQDGKPFAFAGLW